MSNSDWLKVMGHLWAPVESTYGMGVSSTILATLATLWSVKSGCSFRFDQCKSGAQMRWETTTLVESIHPKTYPSSRCISCLQHFPKPCKSQFKCKFWAPVQLNAKATPAGTFEYHSIGFNVSSPEMLSNALKTTISLSTLVLPCIHIHGCDVNTMNWPVFLFVSVHDFATWDIPDPKQKTSKCDILTMMCAIAHVCNECFLVLCEIIKSLPIMAAHSAPNDLQSKVLQQLNCFLNESCSLNLQENYEPQLATWF